MSLYDRTKAIRRTKSARNIKSNKSSVYRTYTIIFVVIVVSITKQMQNKMQLLKLKMHMFDRILHGLLNAISTSLTVNESALNFY